MFESVKKISKTLIILLLFIPFLYSKGIYERTLLIKDTTIRETLLPFSFEWKEKMEEYQISIVFNFMSEKFLLLSEGPKPIPEVVDPNAPTRKYSQERPLRVLLVGDSMAMILGYSFTKEFIDSNFLDFTVDAKAATSLSLPEYFDWPKKFSQTLEQKKYDLILIHIGANDAQAIRLEGKLLKFGSEEWKKIYLSRIQSFIEIAKQTKSIIYWIGLPSMQSKYFNNDISILNESAISVCQQQNIRFIPTKATLGDEKGEFTKTKLYNGQMVIIRSEDGIHANRFGAFLIRDTILNIIKEDFIQETSQGKDQK